MMKSVGFIVLPEVDFKSVEGVDKNIMNMHNSTTVIWGPDL